MSGLREIDIDNYGTLVCQRSDGKPRYIEKIIDGLNRLQEELISIKCITEYNPETHNVTIPLTEFKTITRTKYHLDNIKWIVQYTTEEIQKLERELIEDEFYKTRTNNDN